MDFSPLPPEDPVLRQRLVDLWPTVNPDEARRVAYIAYTTGRELAQKWQMGASPTIHSFLINIGARKAGLHQFATELLLRLDAQKFKTLELHWAESMRELTPSIMSFWSPPAANPLRRGFMSG